MSKPRLPERKLPYLVLLAYAISVWIGALAVVLLLLLLVTAAVQIYKLFQ